ncbi:MAG: tRNA pseudouridine synthase, TruD family [halophilic archaeon J07HX5]|nr:MAG: tRNA pseudouridine synthase, TruD family [halophilic archaeon J07HX5]
MRPAHPRERAVGIEHYVSDVDGVGGRLRTSPADFCVRELETLDPAPIDADPDAYPHLVVRARLRDWETTAFAGRLSDKLGISRERVSWAGTKDKRAITTQLFSVQGVTPPLPAVAEATIEPVGRTGRPVLFGDLAGNAFEIVVRDSEQPTAVSQTTATLRAFAGDDETTTVAVPNYFGQQRFGSRRVVTHEVGLAVVRGDWEGAVMAYLGGPSEREPDLTREARSFVDRTHDWSAALERFPDWLGRERAMLHALADGASFRAALESVPSSLQRLFVNAAQSALFNRMISERLDRGLPFDRPVVGDVVCFTTHEGDIVRPAPERTQRVTADRLETVRRHCERGRAFVTAPLVGTETELGGDEPGEIERAVLTDAGIEPSNFDRPGEFHSTGTRRAILLTTDLTVDRDPLQFNFRLPSGAYATTLLREYLKDPDAL